MLQTIMIFLRRHGFLIVLVGFLVSFLFTALYMACIYRHANAGLRNTAFYAIFSGIGIFAVGRIGVFLENRARRRTKMNLDYPHKDSV